MSKWQERQPQVGHNLFIDPYVSKIRWAVEGAPDALTERCPTSDRLSLVASRATPRLRHCLHSNSTIVASSHAH
jgi:hypothetical protein